MGQVPDPTRGPGAGPPRYGVRVRDRTRPARRPHDHVRLQPRPALDADRRAELTELFAGSTAGLVFVSCFLTRAEMQDYFMDIAWETVVWCADDPTHLIRLDGGRLFGA